MVWLDGAMNTISCGDAKTAEPAAHAIAASRTRNILSILFQVQLI